MRTIILVVTLFAFSMIQGQSRLENYLEELDQNNFSGIIVVAREGEIDLVVDFGSANRESDIAWTTKTISSTGSITKQFTAAAILKLEEGGKINLNDRLNKYIENLPADQQTISLHQLLTHSAGYPGYIGDDFDVNSSDAFLEQVIKTQLLFNPGSGYEYSNVGYSLLAMIIEQVSGSSYEQYLADNLFEPAGMKTTGYFIEEIDTSNLAIGYTKDEVWGSHYQRYKERGAISWHLKGNGGILSTPEDMILWDAALNKGEILNKASLEKMYTPHVKESNGDVFYGYGYTIRNFLNTRLIKHNGGNGIFFADFLRFVDEELAIYLASNVWDPVFADVALDISGILKSDDYKPASLSKAPLRVFQSIPENAIGDKIGKFLECFSATKSESDLSEFISNVYAEGFIEQFGMEKHVEMLNRLRAKIGSVQLQKIEQLEGNTHKVYLKATNTSDLVVFELSFENEDRPTISGIGVDFLN